MAQVTSEVEQQQSLLDDDTLNESERKFIELFERRGTTSDADVDATASAEDEVEHPASPPGTPSDSTAAPVPPSQVEGPDVSGTENAPPSDSSTGTGAGTDEGESEGGEGESGSTTAPPPTSPAFTFAGQDYSHDDLARAVQVSAWHQQLNDQQVVAIDALLSGRYRLVPADEASPIASPVTQPATSPAPSSQPGTLDDDGAGEWLDPRAEQEISRLRTELTQLQSSVQQQVSPLVQQQLDASMQQRLMAIDSATQSFAQDYSLDESQIGEVLTAVTQAGILPGLLQRHNNDVAQASRAALEMMFWTTPQFREPYQQSRTAADLASLAEQERNAKVKQQQMTALSASGGSVPRRDPKPTTKEDRHSAMVSEIAADMNGQ